MKRIEELETKINVLVKTTVTIPVPALHRDHADLPESWGDFLDEYNTDFIVVAIGAWLEENCESYFVQLPHCTVGFKDETDAAFFKLTWMP